MIRKPTIAALILIGTLGSALAQVTAPAALAPIAPAAPVEFGATTLPTAAPTGSENCKFVRDASAAESKDLITITLPLQADGQPFSGPGKVVVFGVDRDRARVHTTASKLGYCEKDKAIDYFTTADKGVVVIAVGRADGQLHLRALFAGNQFDTTVDGAKVTAVAMSKDKVASKTK